MCKFTGNGTIGRGCASSGSHIIYLKGGQRILRLLVNEGSPARDPCKMANPQVLTRNLCFSRPMPHRVSPAAARFPEVRIFVDRILDRSIRYTTIPSLRVPLMPSGYITP